MENIESPFLNCFSMFLIDKLENIGIFFTYPLISCGTLKPQKSILPNETR